jgi:tRNA (guanine37-N1)-methyltransferase
VKIDIITIFPEVFNDFLGNSIIKRAIQNNYLAVQTINLRDYSHNIHLKVDDTIYGGGSGMLMAFPPLYDAIQALKTPLSKVIYLSPQGKVFKQNKAKKLAKENHLIFICGHYEGLDARVLQLVDEEISIGDYVLTQGELATMVVIDAVARLVDGVIARTSVENDSLFHGLLKQDEYTKPEEYQGFSVPEILLSGHHENIKAYNEYQALKNTYLKRPDLLRKKKLTSEQKKILNQVQEDLKPK